MKNLFYTVASIFTLLFCVTTPVAAESITEFVAKYQIREDGKIEVVEKIVYDFEEEERRGIFRTLERTHPQPATTWYKNRTVNITVDSVTKNGKKEPFTVTTSSDEVEVKIGDADVYIDGVHTYEIRYTLEGALSSGPDGAEFYWNVTGNGWEVPFTSATAVASAESPQILKTKAACYAGVLGSTEVCSEIQVASSSVTFTEQSLLPGEGLTVAVEVDPEFVNVAPLEKNSYLPFGFVLVSLWLMYLIWSVYKHRTANRIDRPVIAQYEPYANYLPMYTGVLFDGRLDAHDLTAGILYLAEQGFIKIKRLEKKTLIVFETIDYEVALLRPLSDIPTAFLKKLSELLFDADAVPAKAILLSDLQKNQVANYKVVQSLQTSLTEDLRASGIMTNTLPPWTTKKTIVSILAAVLFLSFVLVENGFVITLIAFLGTGIISIFAFIDRRTTQGHEIKNHLEGFKLFLSVTDKDRFEFHNAPEKSPELFMKYLPYAIALGVEKKWAEVFAGITIPQPDWYEGGSIGAFSAAALTNDMASFSTSFSASSGTAGSSGGGSSGGGGGGGGGGSW